MWLFSCLASNLLSLLWDFQQYRTLCSCRGSWRFKMLDISKRFKMLDISNRFKIRDFKNIWNVDLWLHTYTASSPPSLLWEFERSRTLQFFIGRWLCIRSNLWFQIEVEEVVHSYDKLRLKRMFMRMPWIWDVKLIKVESPDHDNNIMVNFVEIRRTRTL